MRRPLIAVGALALVALVVVGVMQAGDSDVAPQQQARSLSLAQVSRPLPRSAPRPLAALRADANGLRPGAARALETQLRELRGHPVVVNIWASWCGPCRRELPLLQRQALKRGAQVAFVGINSGDDRDSARALLARFPLPYPSIEDPRQAVAGGYGARGLPVTAFYDARGRRVALHQGELPSEAKLAEEIERYALGGATG